MLISLKSAQMKNASSLINEESHVMKKTNKKKKEVVYYNNDVNVFFVHNLKKAFKFTLVVGFLHL